MHRAVLTSGDGINFRDSDGNALTAIGNVTYKAGDAVWTDGRCIYGWVRPNQPHRLTFPSGAYNCPWLEVTYTYPYSAFTLPFSKPEDMKKLCDLSEAIREKEGVFVAGEKASYIVCLNGPRRAIHLETSEEITLASPEHAATQDFEVYDACVDDDGNLLILEVYLDESRDYFGFAVHRNGEIIGTVDGITGDEHEYYTEDTGKTVYLTPLALHLRPDGSFCGTMTENEIYMDTFEETVSVIDYDPVGDVYALGMYFKPEYLLYSGALREYQTEQGELPYKDACIANVHQEAVMTGSLFYYDSREQAKTHIYTLTEEATGDAATGAFLIDGDIVFDTSDGTFNSKGWELIRVGDDEVFDASWESTRISQPEFRAFAGVVKDVRTANDRLPSGLWVGEVESEKTEEGTPYEFDLDGATVSCEAPSNPALDGLGEYQRWRLLPYGFTGGASVRGVDFQQAENQIFDVVRAKPGAYLILGTDGLHLSQSGRESVIRPGFAAITAYQAFTNARIRESNDINAVREGLENEDI